MADFIDIPSSESTVPAPEIPLGSMFRYERETELLSFRLREPVAAGQDFSLRFDTCKNPFCACGILEAACFPVPSGAGPLDSPKDPLRFSLDLDTRGLAKTATAPTPEDRALADALQAQMTDADASFLAWAFGVCREAQLTDNVLSLYAASLPEAVAEQFSGDPSITVAFDILFPRTNQFRCVHQGTAWRIVDLYCCNPGCLCTEVRLEFFDLSAPRPGGSRPLRSAGGIWLDHDTGSWSLRDAHPQKTALPAAGMLAELRRAYASLDQRLARRHAQARRALACRLDLAGKPLEPERRATPKIGRNDLCPCGSGRKYKKCCLPSDDAAAPT